MKRIGGAEWGPNIAVFLKVWSPDQQHKHHLGKLLKVQIRNLYPGSTESISGGGA